MKLGFRVWVLIIVLIFAVVAIRPTFETGVYVKSVEKDSEIFQQGLRQGEIIKEINGQQIKTVEDYSNLIENLFSSGQEVRLDIITKSSSYALYTNQTPQITISKVAQTKIKTGLDIQGGARALVQPEEKLTDDQLQDLIEVSSNRFNVFGLSDVKIRPVTDLAGEQFMLIEIAGATPSDLESLVGEQGNFEAKIENQTVFTGDNNDITSVCRNDARCAGIQGCSQFADGYSCNFAFAIYLSEEAAKRHATITEGIPVDPETGGQYLKENLTLYLDGEEVDVLRISSSLKGQETTEISIQGSGQGATQEDAFNDAQSSMKQLQTVLITGSLPYKLNIVKLDTISPLLGSQFVSLIFLAGAAAIVAVALIVFIRYRRFKASLALLFTSFSELLIILGVAALIGWNLDLPSLAGVLATIGTGVDQQIVILDEARTGKETSLKERMKRALFIVMAAYGTSLVSLLPLYWAGAGLFKGFAITSIIGITAGVFITRPAFADIIKRIEE